MRKFRNHRQEIIVRPLPPTYPGSGLVVGGLRVALVRRLAAGGGVGRLAGARRGSRWRAVLGAPLAWYGFAPKATSATPMGRPVLGLGLGLARNARQNCGNYNAEGGMNARAFAAAPADSGQMPHDFATSASPGLRCRGRRRLIRRYACAGVARSRRCSTPPITS
jgi:hypothetical protein